MLKKSLKLLCISASVTLLFSSTVFAGIWQPKNGRWKYREGDAYVTSKWVNDQNNWYYIDAQGYMQTGWLLDQEDWYYLNESGVMLTNTTQVIDNMRYTFDASGKVIEESSPYGSWSGNTYTNETYQYSITFPDGYQTDDWADDEIHFSVEKNSASMIIGGAVAIEEGKNLQSYIDDVMEDSDYYDSSWQKSEVVLGGHTYIKLHISYVDFYDFDVYLRQDGSNIVCFAALYEASYQGEVQQIFQSIR